MRIKITYPSARGGAFGRRRLLHILRWPFILAAIAATVTNICVGGPLWFILALVGLYAVWKMILSIDLVEYNRLSQSIKTVVFACILLTLIDVLLAPGWALFVVPIVCFSGLVFCSVLFFTNIETQKHNMLPLILFNFFAIIGSVAALSIWHENDHWPFIVLCAVSVASLLSLIIILGADFRREMAKRFHIK